jgi:hypothetical protein
MRPKPDDLAATEQADTREQRFYLCTVLWTKGAAVEALGALSAVVEWVSQEAEDKAKGSDERQPQER